MQHSCTVGGEPDVGEMRARERAGSSSACHRRLFENRKAASLLVSCFLWQGDGWWGGTGLLTFAGKRTFHIGLKMVLYGHTGERNCSLEDIHFLFVTPYCGLDTLFFFLQVKTFIKVMMSILP